MKLPDESVYEPPPRCGTPAGDAWDAEQKLAGRDPERLRIISRGRRYALVMPLLRNALFVVIGLHVIIRWPLSWVWDIDLPIAVGWGLYAVLCVGAVSVEGRVRRFERKFLDALVKEAIDVAAPNAPDPGAFVRSMTQRYRTRPGEFLSDARRIWRRGRWRSLLGLKDP